MAAKSASLIRARRLWTDTPFGEAAVSFFASRIATISFIVLVIICLGALLAPLIAPQNPYDLTKLSILDGELPPFSVGGDGFLFIAGTDDQGRDILSAILYGLRTSLSVGVISTSFALVFGLTMGLISGYFGGWVDAVIMRIVDLQLSFPAILIAMILLAVLGRGVDKVILALIIVQWAYYTRTIRGAALVERAKEYSEAARCLALSNARILFVHLLPNCLPPLIVIAVLQIGHAIALEAALSFLGLGVPVTEPSLGLLISNGQEYMLSGQYWLTVFPGVALLSTMVAVNLVGDQLRDVLNPRMKA